MTNYQTYLLVSLIWAVLLWGTTAYVVFILGNSGWWFLLAVMLSSITKHPEFMKEK